MRRRSTIFIFSAALVVAAFSFVADSSSAQQAGASVLTPSQLTELLDRVGAHAERYKETFKDLTAEERRTFEQFAADGKVEKQNQLVADLIVYQSQRNANRATEFRNIREVDGRAVKQQDERLEKLFARLVKEDAADKEMSRIIKESTRYDFGYQLSGYLYYKAMASWKALRPVFQYDAIRRERLGERDLTVISFAQTQFRKDLFGMEGIFDPAQFTGPLMRGTFWIDAETGQIWREHHEIFFRAQSGAETYKIIEVDMDFAPSKFEVFLPQRVVLQHFRQRKAGKDAPPQMYRSARVISKFSNFQRFNTEGRQENAPRQ